MRKCGSDSKVGILYRILKLNSEAIPTLQRIEIAPKAKAIAYEIRDKRDSIIRNIANKFRRRGTREFFVELQSNLISRLKSGEEVDVRTKF